MWVVMPFGLKNAPPIYQCVVNMTFHEYLGIFMKFFLDDFSVFNDMNTHLVKLHLCFNKCQTFGISFNLKKCMFMVFSRIILKLLVPKTYWPLSTRWYQKCPRISNSSMVWLNFIGVSYETLHLSWPPS